ncbi:E2 [Wels catfish papillomavirus 1]|nr:E2 [Wels catfish papillomavirus 1]
MSTIPDLAKEEIRLLKQKIKIKTLVGGIEQLEHELGHIHNQQLYRQRNNTPSRGTTLWTDNNRTVFHIKSSVELLAEKDRVTFALDRFKKLHSQRGDSTGWTTDDFTKETILRQPSFVLKKGGSYNDLGYKMFTLFFVPDHGKYQEAITSYDTGGLYFLYNKQKIYYDQYDAPKKTKKKKRAPSRVPQEPHVGLTKQLLPKTGHGVQRLLAEAADPPIIEFKGKLEVIKGFVKRALINHPEIVQTSTTYHWGLPSKREPLSSVLMQFKDVTGRDHFLQTTTLKLPDYRLGNLDPWHQ